MQSRSTLQSFHDVLRRQYVFAVKGDVTRVLGEVCASHSPPDPPLQTRNKSASWQSGIWTLNFAAMHRSMDEPADLSLDATDSYFIVRWHVSSATPQRQGTEGSYPIQRAPHAVSTTNHTGPVLRAHHRRNHAAGTLIAC